MKYKLLFIFIVFPLFVFSQQTERKLLLGQVLADTMDVDNITVHNVETNIFAVTDQFGKFAIFAREKDTLVFTSMTFSSRSLTVDESDFEMLLKIKLDVVVNQLAEVIVSPIRLTGDLNADSKKFKNKLALSPMRGMKLEPKDYTPDNRTKMGKNESMPVGESALQGINFNKIGAMIIGLFGGSKPKEVKPVKKRTFLIFADAVKQRFSYHFLTQTLKVAHDDIGLFLNFCDTEEVEQHDLLLPENELQLTEFLILKSKEFHKNK